MALTFNGSNQYCLRGAAVRNTTPMTMAIWVKPTASTGVSYCYMSIGRNADADEAYVLGQRILAWETDRVCAGNLWNTTKAYTSASPTAGAWNHVCGVFSSSTDRKVYLNGGNSGTTTTDTSPSTVDRTDLARWNTHGSTGAYFSGSLAFPVVWNTALTDDDVAMLAKGAWPPLIKPNNLVVFWPLSNATSPTRELIVGSVANVYNSPTVTDNPRIFYPPKKRITTTSPIVTPSFAPTLSLMGVG